MIDKRGNPAENRRVFCVIRKKVVKSSSGDILLYPEGLFRQSRYVTFFNPAVHQPPWTAAGIQ
jgi:hypothetical protein